MDVVGFGGHISLLVNTAILSWVIREEDAMRIGPPMAVSTVMRVLGTPQLSAAKTPVSDKMDGNGVLGVPVMLTFRVKD